tara:strand:+ start:1036 stop:2169 length:1134 start_codon:yes stop_codon:yes gene_type:complete
LILTADSILLPQGICNGGCLVIDDDRIVAASSDVSQSSSPRAIDFPGAMLAPGLIDTHIHGFYGCDVMEGKNDVEAMSVHLVKSGVTAFLPTISPASRNELKSLIHDLKGAKAEGSTMIGMHLEGPFLDPDQPGMFDPNEFREFSADEFNELVACAGGLLRIMTISFDGNIPGCLPMFKEHGVIPSIGHCNAVYEVVKETIDSGLTRSTHFFNAMSALHHRNPGVVGAIMESDNVIAELILDGHHVHEAAARILLMTKDKKSVALVSDAMPWTGMGDGKYRWRGYQIQVSDGVSRVNKKHLAGSTLSMNLAVSNAWKWLGVNVKQAVEMGSIVPAISAGLANNRGSLAAGNIADVVVLDEHLVPVATVVAGRIVWQK